MMSFMNAAWIKPFSVAWRARGYLILGGTFWLVSLLPLPFQGIPEGTLEWWQVAMSKAFGSLDKISYAILFAGLVYAVLSDALEFIWTSRLQDEIRLGVSETSTVLSKGLSEFTSGLVGMSFEAIKVWIEGKSGKPNQVRLVGASSLKAYYGDHLQASDNILDFVLDEILESSAHPHTQTWENFSTVITIRKGSVPGHFEWEETKNYTVVHPLGSGTIPIRLENSWQVSPNHIQAALAKLEFNVRLDTVQFANLQDLCRAHAEEFSQPKFNVQDDGVRIAYDGVWLTLAIEKDPPMTKTQTRVSIYESSYISEQDRCYGLVLRHPAKGLQVSISLEGLPNWVVKQPIASASAYLRGRIMVDIRLPNGRATSADLRGWTLPGLALLVEWTPTDAG